MFRKPITNRLAGLIAIAEGLFLLVTGKPTGWQFQFAVWTVRGEAKQKQGA